MMPRRAYFLSKGLGPCLLAILILSLCVVTGRAQILQNKKPTELVVKRYEKLVAEGALLTPEGWRRVSTFFEQTRDYPANSKIQLISLPGIIGEDSLNGDRAQVGTKWGDYCGTIDSNLRYVPDPLDHGCIMTEESFSLVLVHQGLAKRKGVSGDPGEWKIEEAPSIRTAGIEAAIKYVEEARNRSNDPKIRRNADRTIAALRRLSSSCGTASAC
jgi:hypothetical protein